MAVKLHNRTGRPEKVRLPVSKTLIWWAAAGVLALALGLFSVFYFAFDAQQEQDATARGYLPDDVVPEYLEDYVATE